MPYLSRLPPDFSERLAPRFPSRMQPWVDPYSLDLGPLGAGRGEPIPNEPDLGRNNTFIFPQEKNPTRDLFTGIQNIASSTSPSMLGSIPETLLGTWPESVAKRQLWADQLTGGNLAPRSMNEGMNIQRDFRPPEPGTPAAPSSGINPFLQMAGDVVDFPWQNVQRNTAAMRQMLTPTIFDRLARSAPSKLPFQPAPVARINPFYSGQPIRDPELPRRY